MPHLKFSPKAPKLVEPALYSPHPQTLEKHIFNTNHNITRIKT